jgi:hypothetical protein
MNSLERHHHPGIAERLGRWSSEHRAKAILLWIALLLVAVVAAGSGAKMLSNAGESSGDSAKAERLLENGGRPAGGGAGAPAGPRHRQYRLGGRALGST